ncbi:MAG: amidohydrolase family protein [Armatimonadetes bacterium]|nr:amidohydrolase family protein [Armatimonadota bacterium]
MSRKSGFSITLAAVFFLFSFFFFAGHRPVRSQVNGGTPKGYIDVHMHLRAQGRAAGGQRSPGPGRRPPLEARQGRHGGNQDLAAAADNLISIMDRLGIAKAIILPPPQKPGQQGAHTYKNQLGAIRSHPDRLVLGAGGGELNPIIQGTDPSSVTPAIRAEFERKAEEIIRDGAHVFGEMTCLHFSFGQTHVFEQVPPDHPLFLLLADIAAKNNIPIDLHWEAVPEEMATPQALIERSSNNPARVQATVPGLERLLSHNRKARIVVVHVGWDNTGYQTVDLLRRLLKTHPNLYCGLKFVRKQYEPFQRGNNMADQNLRIKPEWVQLMSDFSDRFVVGADEFVGTQGSKGHGPPSLEDTWTIIEQLPAAVRTKVGRDNAARIYGL